MVWAEDPILRKIYRATSPYGIWCSHTARTSIHRTRCYITITLSYHSVCKAGLLRKPSGQYRERTIHLERTRRTTAGTQQRSQPTDADVAPSPEHRCLERSEEGCSQSNHPSAAFQTRLRPQAAFRQAWNPLRIHHRLGRAIPAVLTATHGGPHHSAGSGGNSKSPPCKP